MRRRGFRVFVVVAVIVALSIAALSLREINFAGLNANGTGPLGLTLGLDLEGGSDLWYQADIPIEVVFQDAVEESQIRSILDGLEQTRAIIRSNLQTQFTIRGPSLTEDAQEELRPSLETLAAIETLITGDDVMDVTFVQALDRAVLRNLLDEAEHTEASLTQVFTIRGLSLDGSERARLRDDLAQLVDIERFDPGEEVTIEKMEGAVNIIERRVNALGTTQPIIQTLGNDRIVVQLPGVGGSSIAVTFLGPLGAQQIVSVMESVLERTGDSVEPTSLNSYIIRPIEALSTGDSEALQGALEELVPLEGFEVVGEDEITVTFPPLPNQGTIGGIMAGLGHEDFAVQSTTVNSFIVRTDKALTTGELDAIREALATEFGIIVAFNATGGLEEAKSLIRGTAQLVFRERNCLVTLGELAANPLLCEPVELGGLGRLVDKDIDLTGEDLSRAFPGRDPTTNLPLVNVQFNSRGTDIFRELTRRLFNMGELGRIAIFLDNQQISAPVVRSPILDGRAVIQGGFTNETAQELSIQLESGRLPVPLTLIKERTVDALLGADSLRKSLMAGLVGLGLVLLFVVAYYRIAGVVAAISLLVYAVIIMAIFKLIPITLTLSGIAGIVLSIGIAVDANILIFERMKEEMRTGRTLTSSMEVGFRRAWTAIRDSNVSTIITCLILWWFGDRLGASVVTGFAITLLIGVAVSMFTALMVSRNLLQILALTPIGKNLDLFTPESRRRAMGVAGASPEPNQRGGE